MMSLPPLLARRSRDGQVRPLAPAGEPREISVTSDSTPETLLAECRRIFNLGAAASAPGGSLRGVPKATAIACLGGSQRGGGRASFEGGGGGGGGSGWGIGGSCERLMVAWPGSAPVAIMAVDLRRLGSGEVRRGPPPPSPLHHIPEEPLTHLEAW